jgi:putative sigma-54 modulation protein
MIPRLDLTGQKTELTPDIKKYVNNKIGKLDRYIPKKARQSAHAEVILKESKLKNRKQCTCEVILVLPHDSLAAKETTINMFAAVDIVEAKLRNQLKKYKETHSHLGLHKRLLARIRRTPGV